MIDADIQQQMRAEMGAQPISVPDQQDSMAFAGEAPTGVAAGGYDIATLQRIRAEVGEQALTDDEFAALQMHEQTGLPSKEAADHYANLAQYVTEADLHRIGQDVIDWVRWDEESRAEWFLKEKRGIAALGVSGSDEEGAFKGGSTVTHPMLGEAIVQFSARALEQLWPGGGPVKTAVLGAETDALVQQAKRVEQFMNFQYTQEIPGAFERTDRLLVRLPLSGSVFIKTFFDPIDGLRRELIEPADFIVPYRANDLLTATRYTERIFMSQNDLRKRQIAGYYRDVDLVQPFEFNAETNRELVSEAIHRVEGRERVDVDYRDQRRTLYECYCEMDLPGFEHRDDEGKPTGIALQYIVTVDHDSRKVLSIYRNWKQDDPRKRRIVIHTHYRFMEGLGFYGYGLYHWIGGLARAATGALRALLDSAQFANMPGGFRSKDAALPNGNLDIAPGEWREVDADSDDLRKAFFPLPYKEPSAVLLNLLGLLQTQGRSFVSTAESMVGDGAQNIPVGTILARIEQGSKVQTGIQYRLHQAQSDEFKVVAYLNSIYLPERYPYAVQGADRVVLRNDFDARIDVVPVSDPNTVSNMQRYFMVQSVLELAARFPGLYDVYELNRRALQTLRMDSVDALLPPQNKPPKRFDPVTENALLGLGRPVRALQDQAHDAHIAVHQQAMQSLPQGHPALPALNSHIQEHLALAYLQEMAQATGMPFQLPDDSAQDLPPEVEMRIAVAAADAVQKMQNPPLPDPKLIEVEREQARKDAVTQADIKRADDEAQAEVLRKDKLAAADIASRSVAQQQSIKVTSRSLW